MVASIAAKVTVSAEQISPIDASGGDGPPRRTARKTERGRARPDDEIDERRGRREWRVQVEAVGKVRAQFPAAARDRAPAARTASARRRAATAAASRRPSSRYGRIVSPQRPAGQCMHQQQCQAAERPADPRSQARQARHRETRRLQQPAEHGARSSPHRRRSMRPLGPSSSLQRRRSARRQVRRRACWLQAAAPGYRRRSPTIVGRNASGEGIHRAIAVRDHVVEMLRRAPGAADRCGRTAERESRAARPFRCRRRARSGTACSRCESAPGRAAEVPV